MVGHDDFKYSPEKIEVKLNFDILKSGTQWKSSLIVG